MTASRAAGHQPARRRAEERVEAFELAIDPDPQRLERARRRIDALVAAPRNRPPDDAARAGRSSSTGDALRAPATIARAMRRE